MCISKRLMIQPSFLIAVFFAVAAVSAQDGGIEVISGNTIFESGSRVSLSHLYSSRGSSMEEHRAVLGFNHGVTPELSLSLLLPALQKVSGHQRSEGLGDAALLGKYRFFSEYWKQSAFHASAIGGLELPTGSTRERDGETLLEPSMQLGTGSVDAIGGLALTLSIERFRFDAQMLYKANTEGSHDYSEGDFFVL
ncbi:MAG: transporter, partial [Planctomycetota bacterium]|nr:transporter [Planctomycetota bacterium]